MFPNASAALLALSALALLAAPGLPAQTLSPEHQRIDFLVGEWRTTSEFPGGSVGEGELTYRWVLDGAWMKVEFSGDPPGGGTWEAHVMQRWNPEEEAYEAWSFPAQGAPVRYRGTSPEPGTYRIEHTSEDGGTTGIDYRRTEEGSVYQENWALRDGERRVTLRTTYRRVGGSER